MTEFKRVEPDDIRIFETIMPGRVLYGESMAEDYSHDEMTEYGRFMPDAVLFADSTQEVSAVMRYCHKQNIAVTPRGAGTGLCGGCVAKWGGILLSTEKMKQVMEIDRRNMTITLQPGILLMDMAKILADTDLFYPPDPGEKSATIGGNVMTNAGGMRAVRYGVTRDYVLGMEIVLPDGEVISLGGKIVKNSSGYSLLDLMIGSEGTLGILTQVTLKLISEPKVNLSLLVPFSDLEQCIYAVPKVLHCGEPTAIEFMEREVIKASEEYLGRHFPDNSADAYLLIRLDGSSRQALEPAVEEMTDLLLSLGAVDVLLADTEERKSTIWDARGAFLEAINSSTSSMDECDVVVPRDKIVEFVKKSTDIGVQFKLRMRSFGHAGDGNLHIYVCKGDLSDEEWEPKRAAAMEALYAEAERLGGKVSGEHGIGHAKVEYLESLVGERQMDLMRGIKAVFDPKGILNPGKVVGFNE